MRINEKMGQFFDIWFIEIEINPEHAFLDNVLLVYSNKLRLLKKRFPYP